MSSSRQNQTGLQVAPNPQDPPDLNHLIVDVDGGRDERMPPAAILTDIAQQLRVNTKCAACSTGRQQILDLVFCSGCRRCFHRHCWSTYRDHTPETTLDEPCQTYSNLDLHLWMRHLHSPQKNEDKLMLQLAGDRPHRWIGIESNNADHTARNDDAFPNLLLFPALTKQFTDIDEAIPMPTKQFPRLISFFGDTGKGKSTVVQNLIRTMAFSKANSFDTPVVGASMRSTSGGIHVYCDPETFQYERPIIYADCEGLAGDSEPSANRVEAVFDAAQNCQWGGRATTTISTGIHSRSTQPTTSGCKSKVTSSHDHISTRMITPVSTMDLPWLKSEDHSRGGASHWTNTIVDRIYPRFLYVFSDVVCYISNDPKAAEHDMARLVDWAHEARDFTTNQGVKPSLLYIVNQDNHSDFAEWRDVKSATEGMLRKWRSSRRFVKEQLLWRQRGATVDTADQLLRCYYRNVTVLFVPQFLPQNMGCGANDLRQQYDLLYEQIVAQSWESSEKRKDCAMLFDLQAFSRYSMRVLEQLAADPHCSVDLKELAEPLRDQPTNFISHVLNVLRRLQEQSYNPNELTLRSEVRLIERTLGYVVCCIAGEVLRNKNPDARNEEIVLFGNRWKEVLEQFRQKQCRCEEMSQGQRCRNYSGRHSQGHQFELNGNGRVQAGDFKSTFPDNVPNLHQACIKRLMNSNVLKPGNAATWSHELLVQARHSGVEDVISNRTCLACLSRTPLHVLPCSHSICDVCATGLSRVANDGVLLTLKRCPFGCRWSSGKPLEIYRKPSEAGVRTLSLDGGGVRGIVELVVLQSIMNRVGHGLPVQEMFDVIMGTSTGGIIALGIFKKKWSIEDAIKRFEELVDPAFCTRGFLRPWMWLPGSRFCAQLFCEFVFRSEGIEGALRSAFDGGSNLFGPPLNNGIETNKVAVIATGDEEEQPVLLANYNREWRVNDQSRDNLRREEKKENELKIWEACRCTSAAPTYFEPYKHPATGNIYTDGAMEKNNPVSLADNERKFIWPATSEHVRDIVVSIGTGLSTDKHGVAERDPELSKVIQGLKHVGLISKIVILRSVLQNTLNCQKMWNEFIYSLGADRNLLTKCHRINIPYGQGQTLCSLDDVQRMEGIKAEALNVLAQTSKSVDPIVQNQLSRELDVIARQLVASLFYLAVQTLEALPGDGRICHGWVRCRLSRGRQEQFKSILGKHPAFRVIDSDGRGGSVVLAQRGWDTTAFSIPAHFRLSALSAEVRIEVTLDSGRNWDAISGFPRNLYFQVSH